METVKYLTKNILKESEMQLTKTQKDPHNLQNLTKK